MFRVIAVLLIVWFVTGSASAQSPRPKKLIIAGWDMPTTAQLRRDLGAMQDLPFDGATVWLHPTVSTGLPNSTPPRIAFGRQPWKREWFADAIADLQAVQAAPTRLTDIFLRIDANPGDVDWFDDAGWAEIVDHFRIMAWVAKEGRAKGICFDPEPYTKPYEPFNYQAQTDSGEHSLDECLAQARRRGSEVMRAMAEEYPNITLFTYFMDSYLVLPSQGVGPAVGGRSPAEQKRAQALNTFGLYGAFIDGWLDAAPPMVVFVDGNENAYHYTDEDAFHRAASMIKGAGQELVSPENRLKYRAQVQVGAGIWIDAHIPSLKVRGQLKGAGLPLLRQNVAAACETVDEYVWLHGEKGRWWPEPGDLIEYPKKVVLPTWESVAPGITAAIAAGRDLSQSGEVDRALGQSAKGTNLLRNGDFSDGPAPAGPKPNPNADGIPVGWTFWPDARSSGGQCSWDSPQKAVRLAGVRKGVVQQNVPVKPGERYLVSARSRTQGRGLATIACGWKKADQSWLWDEPQKLILAPTKEAASSDDWSEWNAIVVIPKGVGVLALLLSVDGQRDADDVTWWDHAALKKLPASR
jgi:hypothetical protein